MCLLTYFPPGVLPDTQALSNGADYNDDGHGYCIVSPLGLLIRKGMDSAEIIDDFARVRKEFPDGPAMFHSRIKTHGLTSIENCHPFYLGKDRQSVLAHNGIMARNVQPGPLDNRSDTRICAEDWLPSIGSLRTVKQRKAFEKWLGTGNKALLLTVNPVYEANAYLFNEQLGDWVGGIWYSNDSHEERWTRSYAYSGWGEESDQLGWPDGDTRSNAWRQTREYQSWADYMAERSAMKCQICGLGWDDCDPRTCRGDFGTMPTMPTMPPTMRRADDDFYIGDYCWDCCEVRVYGPTCKSCGWCRTCLESADDCGCLSLPWATEPEPEPEATVPVDLDTYVPSGRWEATPLPGPVSEYRSAYGITYVRNERGVMVPQRWSSAAPEPAPVTDRVVTSPGHPGTVERLRALVASRKSRKDK